MNTPLQRALAALVLGAAACATSVLAKEAWPSRAVRLVVPFPAGGATDTIARQLGQQLQTAWKQPVIIDNKPGAGTVIGTDAVAKAAADGYTLGMVVSAHMINPSIRPKLPYDTLKDFAGVSQVGVQHLVMAAHPAFEASTLDELIALARRQPGKLTYASPGSGTAMHLSMELLNTSAGIEIKHIPYRGGAPAQADVMGGQVPLLLDVYHSSAPLIKAGRLKAIAFLSPRRVPALPDVPTMAETVPAAVALSTIGLVAPAGTPAELVERISKDIAVIVRSPAFTAQLADMGVEAVGSSPQAFDAFIRSEITKWTPVVKASGATID